MLPIMGGSELVVIRGHAGASRLRKIFVYFHVFATSIARGTGEVHTVFWRGNLRGKGQLGRPRQ
jgi:hypothetical protein